MTNKYNVTLTDRDLAILKTALGQFGLEAMESISEGDKVFIDGERVHPEEFLSVIEAIKLAEAGTPPESDLLTDVEKFAVSGAIGALVEAMETAPNQARSDFIRQQIDTVAKKLNLFPGAINGAQLVVKAFS